MHRLAQLGVQLVDPAKGAFMVCKASKSSVVMNVKSKHGLDSILV